VYQDFGLPSPKRSFGFVGRRRREGAADRSLYITAQLVAINSAALGVNGGSHG
jgi:hypothetical protein